MSKRKALASIGGIGLAQLFSWGTLYYSIAVMGASMRRELGLSEAELFVAFAFSLALSGVLAPWAGRLVDRCGGRVVQAAGPLVGALGFAFLAIARSGWACLLAVALQGVAMALALYDTCFAALWYQYPRTYRRSIAFVTLVGGLASSVFWPVTYYLVASAGWRVTSWTFALLLAIAGAINFLAFEARSAHADRRARLHPEPAAAPAEKRTTGQALALMAVFAGASFVNAALAAHLPAALHDLRLDAEAAVWIASSVGIMQVSGRALELGVGARLPARRLGLITFVGIFAALLLLVSSRGSAPVALAFAVLYGAANGVFTVVRVVLPAELFTGQQQGALLGRLAAPSGVARAVAPAAFSVLATRLGNGGALACLLVVAGLSLAIYGLALYQDRSIAPRPPCCAAHSPSASLQLGERGTIRRSLSCGARSRRGPRR